MSQRVPPFRDVVLEELSDSGMDAKAVLFDRITFLVYVVQGTENRQSAEKRLQLQAMSQQCGQVLRWHVISVLVNEEHKQ